MATVSGHLPAIDALIKACEAERPIFGVSGELIDNARSELDAYRKVSGLLRRLSAQQRRK